MTKSKKFETKSAPIVIDNHLISQLKNYINVFKNQGFPHANTFILYLLLYLLYSRLEMDAKRIRVARHAGSWYSAKSIRLYILVETLNSQLDKYLEKAQIALQSLTSVKAIIGPHAGYAYSGPNAAWAYKYLQIQA